MFRYLRVNVLARWAPHLALLDLPAGAVLQSAEQPIHNVYFPQDAVVGQFHGRELGLSMAVVLIGGSGFAGCDGVLSRAASVHEDVVVKAGRVLRLGVDHLRNEMDRCSEVRQQVLSYVQLQVVLIARAALCSRFHDTEQQICMRLAQLFGNAEAQELDLTQDELAHIVGARRERVNRVMVELQAAGVVESGRGRIRPLDMPALLRRSCGCHQAWFLGSAALSEMRSE